MLSSSYLITLFTNAWNSPFLLEYLIFISFLSSFVFSVPSNPKDTSVFSVIDPDLTTP